MLFLDETTLASLLHIHIYTHTYNILKNVRFLHPVIWIFGEICSHLVDVIDPFVLTKRVFHPTELKNLMRVEQRSAVYPEVGQTWPT